jgi:hypothetical protein
MTTRKTLMLAALISIAPAGLVMAQSGSMPQDQTPATASSPSATQSPSSSSSSTDSSSPSASSPKTHHHMASKQAMKDCIAKQQQDNSGMSAADAKKACKQQMKGSG